MKTTLFVLIIFLLISVSLPAQETKTEVNKYTPSEKFNPQRDAAKDIADAIEDAQRLDKNIILDVGGEWCIWCHRLDEFFKSHNEISGYMHNNYIVVKVNYSRENKNEKVLSKYPKIPGYPHIFVLDKNGKLLHSQDTGKLESGKGYSEEKIMTFLKKWAPKNIKHAAQ